MSKTVKDVLLDAADLIECIGWAQGTGKCKDDHGRTIGFCVSSAMQESAYRSGSDIVDSDALSYRAHICFSNFLGYKAPHVWNDKPERTATEVIETLRKAAESL